MRNSRRAPRAGALTTLFAPVVALALAALFAVGPSCSATGPSEETPWSRKRPVDFQYQVQGQTRRLADLRGRPVLLVLMRTSEVPSQIYMREVVRAFRNAAGRTRFLVLTIAPSEAPFVAPYAESEQLPFPVGVADWSVARGRTELGEIPIVPTTYLIDSSGFVATAAAGLVKAEEIRQVIDDFAE